MHIDARNLANNSVIQGDICIIGAGTAGISIALEWINTPYKVILLEGGGFEYDDKVQELYNGKITGQKYYPLKSARLHYFGGTTGHWAGMCAPFDEIDFKKRDWVPNSGWPINRKDLDPFYARANKTLQVGPARPIRPAPAANLETEHIGWEKRSIASPELTRYRYERFSCCDDRNDAERRGDCVSWPAAAVGVLDGVRLPGPVTAS